MGGPVPIQIIVTGVLMSVGDAPLLHRHKDIDTHPHAHLHIHPQTPTNTCTTHNNHNHHSPLSGGDITTALVPGYVREVSNAHLLSSVADNGQTNY